MDFNQEVTAYIEKLPEPQKEIMIQLRKLIMESVIGVREQYKWNQPVYGVKKDFCYLKPTKDHVNLGFMNAGKLDDPDNLLEGTGKNMRHVKIKTIDGINTELFTIWFSIAAK